MACSYKTFHHLSASKVSRMLRIRSWRQKPAYGSIFGMVARAMPPFALSTWCTLRALNPLGFLPDRLNQPELCTLATKAAARCSVSLVTLPSSGSSTQSTS